MRRPVGLLLLTLLLLPGFARGQTTRPARPNLVLIVADDLCWRDVGFTGNKDVHTPNLDRLRSQGLQFNRMYSPAATCTPTRSALYTGLYNVRSGAYPNHSDVKPGTQSLFAELKAAGYRVALQNKSDVRPAAQFPFEHLTGVDDFAAARAFMTRDPAQPWLYVFASDDPHSPWNRGPEKLYSPDKISVPPYLHDTPTTRQKLCRYYAEITDLDDQVGHVLETLEASGQADRTLVVFVSEQGGSMPYAGKWTLYDNGIHSAAIARWPGVIRPGSSTDAVASYVDITPTFLAAAGVDVAKVDTGCPDAKGDHGFDGRSFLDVLHDPAKSLRDCAFAQHTALGVYGNSGPVPQRTVTDGRYQLIRCFTGKPDLMIDGFRTSQVLKSWQKDAATDPALAARIDQLIHPPAEQLYDLTADPYELENLAADPKLADVKAKLSKQLDAWMAQQGDQGLATELDFKRHMKSADEGRDPD